MSKRAVRTVDMLVQNGPRGRAWCALVGGLRVIHAGYEKRCKDTNSNTGGRGAARQRSVQLAKMQATRHWREDLRLGTPTI
jgi:hypothetical protein